MRYNHINKKRLYLFQWVSLVSNYSTNPIVSKLNNELNKKLVFAQKLINNKNDTQFVSIYGPDTIEFLNGMVTTKLKDKYVKKNLMTINDEDDFRSDKNVLDELKMLSQNNPLVNDVLNFEEKSENIKMFSLYDELQESYGNIKGQLTSLLNSKSRIISLVRLYTPLFTRRGSKYQEVILELPRLKNQTLNDEHDPIKVLDKHRKLSKIKFNVDIQNDEKLGFDIWEVYFRGSIMRNDFELEILNHIIEDSGMNYSFNMQFHFSEIFKQKDNAVISVFLDDIFYNCSLVDSQNGELVYKYKVLTKKGKIEAVEEIIQNHIEVQIDSNMPNAISNLKKKYGLYEINDINPATLLPLDLALEYSPNCVSFDKGCYIGQELTTRMHSTNKIIKRCVPISINKLISPITEGWGVHTDSPIKEKEIDSQLRENNNALFGSVIKTTKKRNKPVGKVVIYNKDTEVALVSLKLDYLKDFYYFGNPNQREFYLLPPKEKTKKYVSAKDEKIPIHLNNPYWIEEYISEIEEQEALENDQDIEDEDQPTPL